MKKDKEWLKGLINEEGILMDMNLLGRIDEQYWKNENIKINKGRLFYLIDQLEEPEKTLIPQFVADWIEEERVKIIDWHTEIPERFFLILGHKLHYTTLASTNIADWIFGGNEEKLYQALKYGYEVEKEKLYHVVNKENYFMLRKYDGLVDILRTSPTMSRDEFGKDTRFMLTEKEIKDYDERFWAFAEPVEGLEK